MKIQESKVRAVLFLFWGLLVLFVLDSFLLEKKKLVGEALSWEQSGVTKLADDEGGTTRLGHNIAVARTSKIINVRIANVNFILFSFRMLAHYLVRRIERSG